MAGLTVRTLRFARPGLACVVAVLLLVVSAPASPIGSVATPLTNTQAPWNTEGRSTSQVDGQDRFSVSRGLLAPATAASQPRCTETDLPPVNSATAAPKRSAKVAHDEANLEIGADAVAASTVIRATSLCEQSLPPLDQGMTNVTKGPRRGYRFLPHVQFQGKIRLRLPYDRALIPPGGTDQDVRTFYFDERGGSWRELERVAVDPRGQVVTSLTTHFTDMINATVTVPDHPETLSHNPTSIKDIKAADPSANINLIEAPRANSSGDARLSYPIQLPPGRNGMQPQLGLSYDSSGGIGWVGLGWDLATAAVTVDTRWGVPRYEAAAETETYGLNGVQLTPVAHRGQPAARTPEKLFHARVEGQFRKIVRHGTGPTNYWWEVTDKDGTRSFYGGNPDTGGPAADSRLTDGNGNVFMWALRETRDLHGNGVSYTYETVSDAGVPGGTVPGFQLYPKTINYTRAGAAAGAYTVTFLRDSELPGYTRRPDVVINARGGFKMVTAELLKRIDVTFQSQLIRRYDLDYRQGAFNKTLLESITQRGENGAVFHTHQLSYYDELRDQSGGYQGFEPASNWDTRGDNVTAGLLGHGQASALSGALNSSFGGHLYAGFNPIQATKQFSGGGKIGYNHSSSDGMLALIDLNGDNLPDKVFKRGDTIRFRLNRSGPDGKKEFEDPPREVPTLPAISAESSDTVSFGGEVYVVANVFANHATTFTTGSTYFSDVNGDGLPDLVQGGRVLFNHLDANGVPTFDADSGTSPVPVGAGAVDSTGLIQDYEPLYQQSIDTYPLHDTLRRWVAPFDGQIRISGAAALVQDTSQARARYTTADGVRVAIQRNGAELWSARIPADDYNPKTPTGVDSLAVQAGDRIYFRVQSVFDGAYDQVSWDPEIAYLSVPASTDVNNLNAYRYKASEDFVLAGRRGVHVQLPFAGTVRLTGDLRKRGVTTDDVTVLVLKKDAKGATVTVFSRSMAWDQTGDIAIAQDITVAKQDTIQLRIKVDSPIDLRQLEWKPRLFYTASPDVSRLVDDNGDPLIQLHPPYDVDLYPINQLTAPQRPWAVPRTGTVRVMPQLSAAPGANGTVTFTVKRRGALVAKRAIDVTNGSVANVDFNLGVTAGQELFFDYSTYDPELGATLSNKTVELRYQQRGATPFTVPSAFHNAAFPGLFAQPYRGWAYAGYNGNRARAQQPIHEDDLRQTFTKDSAYDPKDAKAYLFNPLPEQDRWRGPDDLGWVKADTLSSSRLGLDAIDVPRPGDFAGGRAVTRLSQTAQTAVGGGVVLLSGSTSSGSSSSEVDYLDLNGDRFPDVVGNGRVQYTGMTGGLEGSNGAVVGLGRPRESDAKAWNVGVGGSPASFKADARGEVDTAGKSPPRSNETGSQMVTVGLSGGLGRGDSDARYDLLDVNGDGLPDRVSSSGSGLDVALNLGYGFAAPESWGTAAINDGASENGSIGVSLGFNSGIYDYAGGLSLSKNKSQTGQTLLDINGDGLLDRVDPNGIGLRVAFNTGNGFAQGVAWGGALDQVCRDNTSVGAAGIDWDKVRVCAGNTGLGGGAYFTIGIGPLCWPTPLCYVIINPGGDYSENMARQEATLRDVDGDGYADHIASTNDSGMQVARNRTGRTNLLKSVKRPLSATIDLEYRRDGNTYDQPHSRWVLSKVTLFDGQTGDGVDTQATTYRYEGGSYNRLEREFYGYRRVIEEHRNTASSQALYRTVVREFRNDSYYTRGLLERVRTLDDAGRPFNETENTYLLRDVATGAEPADPQSRTATIFPMLVRTDERFYEGNPAPGKSTFTTQSYDALGNVDRFTDAGDSGAQDDVEAIIDYTACAATHVLGLPDGIVVTGDGTQLRRREATVDCATGELRQVRQYLKDGTAAVTDLAYFPNGNLRQVTDPPNKRGQRYQLTYDYDPVMQTHVTQIGDSFGYSSATTHDYKYGTVATATDLNGNRTSYAYDGVGRLESVTGPYQQGGGTPTIRFEYHPDAVVPWALTRHIDSFRTSTDTRLPPVTGSEQEDPRHQSSPSSSRTSSADHLCQHPLTPGRTRVCSPTIGASRLVLSRCRGAAGRARHQSRSRQRVSPGPADQAAASRHRPPASASCWRSVAGRGEACEGSRSLAVPKSINRPVQAGHRHVGPHAKPRARHRHDKDHADRSRHRFSAGAPDRTLEVAAPRVAPSRSVRQRPSRVRAQQTKGAATTDAQAQAPQPPTDTIDTVLFVDGLRRILQTKKDATIHTGADAAPKDVMTVSGRVAFDFVGRTSRVSYPVTEPVGTPGVLNATPDTVQPTRMTYDVLDRNTSVTLPDNTATTIAYGFGQDRGGLTQFEAVVKDGNGKQKRTYRDVRELVTSLKEFNTLPNGSSQVIWTSYAYDPLQQLVEVTDDKNNRTRVAYDNLGRRTAVDNPDTGKTETVYDLASNPIAKITAKLRAEGKQITYDYDFKRLKSISYPNFPGNNVAYSYGAPNAGDNRVGRITLVTDESGREERFYGKLGEITKEIKTVASDTQGSSPNSPEVYTTQYTYDTFGRLQTLIYPDGEVLTYRYDTGGMVREATGKKGNHSYSYVKRLEYDKFEQRAFVEAGNNVRTSYSYDPLDRRLANLKAGERGGDLFQNLSYGYDNVGNILSLRNEVPVPRPSQDGGPTTQTFGYDDLYRLTGASGAYQFAPNKSDRYRLTLSYDPLHNIQSKQQTHEIVQPSGVPVTQRKTTYDWTYSYGGPRPHAPTHIGEQTFGYDANGNPTGWTHDRNGTRRTIVWDEENRIQSLFDNGHQKTYKYDDAGERVIKRGPQGETGYVNQYFTIRNREVGTKHVFVGATRLVSKLMKQDKPGGNPGGNQPLEKDRYFFHPDHLGSSNYVTDADGEIYQHLEYFPFGEAWVDESSNIQRTPYRFTGKELDEETGLYYFGARYYDPQTSVWQSPDILIERYLTGLSQGGVYNSANLNLYAYSYQNPIKYTDANGRWVETAWDAFNIGLGVKSFVDNVRQGNYGSAALDAVGIALDSAAAVAPIVPGGVGSIIKAARAADAGIDAVRAIDKGADLAKAVDRTADMARGIERGAEAARTAERGAEAAQTARGAGPQGENLFRSMKAGPSGPEVGPTARTLGARPGTDIPVQGGMVQPQTGGMSVSPGGPHNLPSHRRPPEFGGTGKDPVWCINGCDLPEGLTYRPDPHNPTGHGFIEPSRAMNYSEYEQLLESTQNLWKPL
jgi:RHS repeat-associated protein